MQFEQITVVGVGLIGGSVGLAVRARNLAARVVGVDRDIRTLNRAVELGVLDSFTLDLAEGVKHAELVVVCTPVDRIAEAILAAAPHVRPGTIFTDAGSTKYNVVQGVGHRLPAGVHFVPGHPLAGSEKTGVQHARADLFENRVTVLTGTIEGIDPGAERTVEVFWQALGSRVVKMASPRDHDSALAATSHLPHAVAAGVAQIVPADWLTLSGTGFRDVTRVAAGDPNLWAAIFQANREAVQAALGSFTKRMDEFKRLLEAGDGAGLVRWLSEGKQVRDALGS
jgi:cyclohexadieny/prephenate dehydrogenase